MILKKILLSVFFLTFQPLFCIPLAEQFKQKGYSEICNGEAVEFDSFYAEFDVMIQFLQENPVWAKRIFSAKERFIRTKDKNLYSSNFFGFYDESKRDGRSQISFYYCTHFHEFVCTHYPEFLEIPEIKHFFETCLTIQKNYENLFNEAISELNLEKLYSSNVPIIIKVIKYLPSYRATKPHYDGTALTLFLDSTNNKSLLLSPYKSSFTVDDFSSPSRKFQNSILLIPGILLTELSIYPTPHIVLQSGEIRYATVAFAMRPEFTLQKIELTLLPNFIHIE